MLFCIGPFACKHSKWCSKINHCRFEFIPCFIVFGRRTDFIQAIETKPNKKILYIKMCYTILLLFVFIHLLNILLCASLYYFAFWMLRIFFLLFLPFSLFFLQSCHFFPLFVVVYWYTLHSGGHTVIFVALDRRKNIKYSAVSALLAVGFYKSFLWLPTVI